MDRIDVVVWQEPPSRPVHGVIKRRLQLLRERPGAWALVQKYKNANSASVRASQFRSEHPDFEFCYRQSELYARFIG